jgi:hypothetical protein
MMTRDSVCGKRRRVRLGAFRVAGATTESIATVERRRVTVTIHRNESESITTRMDATSLSPSASMTRIMTKTTRNLNDRTT